MNPSEIARADALLQAGKLTQAAAAYGRLLQAAPQDFNLNLKSGTVLRRLGRAGEAMACLERCLARRADAADPFLQRGLLRVDSGSPQAAIEDFDAALRLQPDLVEAWLGRIRALQNLGRHREAMDDLAHVEELAPEHKCLRGQHLQSAQLLCDWQTLERLLPRLEADVASGKDIADPLDLSMSTNDPVLLRECAAGYGRFMLADLPAPAPLAAARRSGRIRIAYISADFRYHATSFLIGGLIARHDRTRFEIIGISTGPNDSSSMRQWLQKTFDQFLDVRGQSDIQIAVKLRQMEIDIVVDLNGYTRGLRTGVLALRAAPVQVNFLGFPGTMAADFIDYMIADPVVIPREDQHCYSEKIAYLPDCYQPNDAERPRLPPPPRSALGLPEQGFVFCSFNGHRKITRGVFDLWMRLLAAVPGSVLWLLQGSADEALRLEAQQRGIEPARLVFAPSLSQHLHLARVGAADLALDTAPCNGHTTTSDMLWMGVPVVTVLGRTFAGRVSASLLSAIELPELITGTLEDYESLALALARDRMRLQELKARLAANCGTAPLFDIGRYCRHIENAYAVMAERARRGEAPAGFDAA